MNSIQKVANTVLFLFMFGTTLPAPAKISCWVLDSRHSVYGKGIIYVSAQGVRIDTVETGRLLIAQPPDWKVAVFDKNTHKYFVQSAKEYGDQKLTRVFSMIFEPPKEKPARTNIHELVGGVPTTRYVCEAVGVESGRRRPAARMPIQYSVSDKLGLPQATYDAYSRCGGLPQLPGMIMRLKYGKTIGMDTVGSKKQEFPDDFFHYPPGYTAAKSIQEVLFSIDSIKDMIEP